MIPYGRDHRFLCCTNTFGANSWFTSFKILVFCVGGGGLVSNIPLLRLHVWLTTNSSVNTWTDALLLTCRFCLGEHELTSISEANSKTYFRVVLLASRVQIPPKIWMSAFACCVGSGLFDEPVICSEDSYRLCVYVWVCVRACDCV